MSMNEYASIESFQEAVSCLLDDNEISLALHFIHNFVDRIITEPLCTSQVFGSKTLDDLCQRIGSASLAKINKEFEESAADPLKPPVFAYIVTKLQKSGGHTRVIEDFIKAQPAGQHFILSTELDGKSDTAYLLKGQAEKADIIFEQAPKQDYLQRLVWLQKRLIKIRPKRVYLFNHHQDSVAVAAIQPEMKLAASFYHHGDHHLCLGVYLSHLEHIDPHPMGYHNCRDELGIDNTYIPLTVEDKGHRIAELPFLHNGTLTTCTAARSNKIEIPYFVSYLELIPKLLNVTGGRHIHIGKLTPWALFKIRRGIRSHGIQPNRFIYTPWVPSVWKALQHYQVDLYIASFPYGGGLTLIEAMGAGIPVALHRHVFSRVLSGIDLAYSGAFSWRSPAELLDYCVSVTATDLDESGRLGRLQYEQFHTSNNLRVVLDVEAQTRPKPAKLSTDFSVAQDEWAFWMERQLNLSRLLSRGIYRAVKRLRAWW